MKRKCSGIGLGRRGEELAVAHLQAKGYNIVTRNYRRSFGEVDIIAWDGDVLVFVEVKTRRSRQWGSPLEAVDRRKQHRLMRIASDYIVRNRLERHPARFDVVAVEFDHGHPSIRVLQNAFGY